MAQKQYKSPIEEIIKQLEGEEPPYRVRSLENDKVKFGFPEELKLTIGEQLQIYSTPIDGRKPTQPQGQDKFKDSNSNLQLKASSTIQQAAYWPKKEYLVVSFKSGHTYDYQKVPLLKVLQWEQAPSAGSFFYYNIRMSYSYRKVG